MKTKLKTIMIILLVSLFAMPVWAGGAVETARERVAWAAEMGGLDPETAVPEAGLLYFVDLMSNFVESSSNQWISYLVLGNWSLNTRIEINTAFIPTGGTPNDIVARRTFINPNDIVYLGASQLGFNSFRPGIGSNWFVNVWNTTNTYFSAGVLLFNTEYGLTYIPSDGPYQI